MHAITTQNVSSSPSASTQRAAETSKSSARDRICDSTSVDSTIAQIVAGAAYVGMAVGAIALMTIAIRSLLMKLASLSIYEWVQCF